MVDRQIGIREGLVEVALDPQTSGGLLIAIAKRASGQTARAICTPPESTTRAEVGYATSLQKAWVRLV